MAYPDKPSGQYSLRDYDFAQADSKKIPMDEYLFKNGYKNAEESETESVPDAHSQNWLFDVLHRNLKYAVGTAEENKNIVADKVSKTGDTMTGRLNFTTNTPNFIGLYTQNTTFDKSATVAPSTNNYACRYGARDKNNNYVGNFSILHSTANNIGATMSVERTVNGENKTAGITVGVKEDGTAYATAPNPANEDNSNSIATTSFVQEATNTLKTSINDGTITGTTQVATDNSTKLATTAFVHTNSDSKVSKTGDTMTGDLTIQKSGTNSVFISKRTDYDYTKKTAPSANTEVGALVFLDKNGKYSGYINHYQDTSNVMVTRIVSRRSIDGTEKTSALNICVDGNGTSYVTAPTPTPSTDNSTKIATTAWVVNHRCTTRPTTTSTASINAPAYIVLNYLNGTSGYFVRSDGYCEQWGQFTAQGFRTETTVNFLKNFVNTNYQILLSSNYFQNNGDKGSSCGWNVKNTNNCTIRCCFEQSQPIVTWRACGYLAGGQW